MRRFLCDRWQDGVDGHQIGVIPRGDNKDKSEGSAFDVALEPGLVFCKRDVGGGEGGLGDGEHVGCSVEKTSDFAWGLGYGSVCACACVRRGRRVGGLAHLPICIVNSLAMSSFIFANSSCGFTKQEYYYLA